MTVKPAVDPRALSSTLGTAIRIAQRMGLHDETSNIRYAALEAELRRRLWWSIILFDARISEMTEFKVGQLLPTWDCKPPANANDFDLRSEMRIAPEVQSVVSEALFAVVRGEFGDFTRHSAFHLDFINPGLKTMAHKHSTSALQIDEYTAFERKIEQKYLRHCDPHNPLHFMTIWWARGQLARTRFIMDLSESAATMAQRTDAQRDASTSHALAMLDCDTHLMNSKCITGFRWLIYLSFPFPAYVHVVQYLRRRPISELASTAWDIMSANCAARFIDIEIRDNPMERKHFAFFKIFAAVVLQAWAAREAANVSIESNSAEATPLIVTQIKSKLAFAEGRVSDDATARLDDLKISNMDPVQSTDFDTGVDLDMNGDMLGNSPFSMMYFQPPLGVTAEDWGWPTANLHPMTGLRW